MQGALRRHPARCRRDRHSLTLFDIDDWRPGPLQGAGSCLAGQGNEGLDNDREHGEGRRWKLDHEGYADHLFSLVVQHRLRGAAPLYVSLIGLPTMAIKNVE